MNKTTEELLARIEVLEKQVEELFVALHNYKHQMNYQLTKEKQLQRDLNVGKKK